MWLKKGVKLLAEEVGNGPPVERLKYYFLAIRITLNQGDIVYHPEMALSHSVDSSMKILDDGYFLHNVRISRENLIGGIFYAVQGMNVGGYRKVVISPYLAYGEDGIPGVIPANAKLTVEIKVLEKLETKNKT